MSERDSQSQVAICFVRKGRNAQERVVALRLEEGMSQEVLFDLGMALDGNQAIITVTGGPDAPISRVLWDFERELNDALATMGWHAVYE